MLPLLLAPSHDKPARVLGRSPRLVSILQNLRTAGWPAVLYDPGGDESLASLDGTHTIRRRPDAETLLSSSLVLIGESCPEDWRKEALDALQDTDNLYWDERDPDHSTLDFPRWYSSRALSLAVWGGTERTAWQESLFTALLDGTDQLFDALLRLLQDLEDVLSNIEDRSFRQKALSQIGSPEVLSLLMAGRSDEAKTLVLKILGTTTRTLD
ncbi:MAG: hypothetical protein P8Z49_03250 [Acidobacteriota bacterium]|jgi:hypothetical protein